MNGIAALRGIRRGREATLGDTARCDLCGVGMPEWHEHLAATDGRVRCACSACATLFADVGQASGEASPSAGTTNGFARIRGRTFATPDLDEPAWASLGIPVRIAFFCDTGDGVVAYLPNPLGVMKHDLRGPAWANVVRRCNLPGPTPHIEALLAHRIGGGQGAWIVPIDVCWRLAGLVRTGALRTLDHPQSPLEPELAAFFGALPAAESSHA